MGFLKDIFSTRELALFAWAVIVLILICFNDGIRNAGWVFLKTFLSKHIFRIFILMLGYVVLTIYLLRYFGLWDKSFVKDTVFWFFTVALVTFFKVNKADDLSFFKEIVLDSVKWIVLVEFLINFYTLSFWMEMIIIPIVVFISFIYAFSSTKEEYRLVERVFAKILSAIGIALFIYVVYETAVEFQKAFTIQNLKSLLLPVILTALFMPFAYLLALYMKYEVLFVRIGFLSLDEIEKRRVRHKIILEANLNINKLNEISANLNSYVFM